MHFLNNVRVGIEQDNRSGALNILLDQGPFAKRITLGSKKDSPAAQELEAVLFRRELEALSEWRDIFLGGQPSRISVRQSGGAFTNFDHVDIYLDSIHKQDTIAATIVICADEPWFKVSRSRLSDSAQREIASYLRRRIRKIAKYEFMPYEAPTPRGDDEVASAKLSQIIGQFTPLNGNGDIFRGPCPLNGGENKQSMVVDDRTEEFACFNCGAEGGVLDFLMLMAKKATA